MPDTPRWLREARALFLELHGAEAASDGLLVTVDNQHGCTITFRIPTSSAQQDVAGLSPLEQSILRVATITPLTAKRLASLLGRPCNSHFRDALRSLGRRVPPLLVRVPAGYRLPGTH